MRGPDRTGQAARAWRLKAPVHEDRPALLRTWIIHGRGFHAAWDHWMVSAVHLRDIDGQKANKQFPEATHEFVIAALDPGFPVDIDAIESDPSHDGIRFLTPLDLAHHVELPEPPTGDLQAAEMTDMMVARICAGAASPDQDWRRYWIKALNATAEHYRSGQHV